MVLPSRVNPVYGRLSGVFYPKESVFYTSAKYKKAKVRVQIHHTEKESQGCNSAGPEVCVEICLN